MKEQEGKKENMENRLEILHDEIEDFGTALLPIPDGRKIQLISIIGEIEGHDASPKTSKTTKYEHLLPRLAIAEADPEIAGVLMLLNTVGGDVEAGLAIAEMLASISKPVVSLVLGGSHSIGVPLAVSGNYSLIAETATMIVHPVRVTGMVIGVAQSFEYMEQIQERILGFVVRHSKVQYEKLKSLMLNTHMLTKDIGTILVGKEAVEIGLIDEVGGISAAAKKLMELINKKNERNEKKEDMAH